LGSQSLRSLVLLLMPTGTTVVLLLLMMMMLMRGLPLAPVAQTLLLLLLLMLMPRSQLLLTLGWQTRSRCRNLLLVMELLRLLLRSRRQWLLFS
jgi:hypothetical protein